MPQVPPRFLHLCVIVRLEKKQGVGVSVAFCEATVYHVHSSPTLNQNYIVDHNLYNSQCSEGLCSTHRQGQGQPHHR